MKVLGAGIALIAVFNKVNANDCTGNVARCVEKAVTGTYTKCGSLPISVAMADEHNLNVVGLSSDGSDVPGSFGQFPINATAEICKKYIISSPQGERVDLSTESSGVKQIFQCLKNAKSIFEDSSCPVVLNGVSLKVAKWNDENGITISFKFLERSSSGYVDIQGSQDSLSLTNESDEQLIEAARELYTLLKTYNEPSDIARCIESAKHEFKFCKEIRGHKLYIAKFNEDGKTFVSFKFKDQYGKDVPGSQRKIKLGESHNPLHYQDYSNVEMSIDEVAKELHPPKKEDEGLGFVAIFFILLGSICAAVVGCACISGKSPNGSSNISTGAHICGGGDATNANANANAIQLVEIGNEPG